MEAENAKLKAKLERVKSTRKAEEKKAMATKKAAGGGGTDDEIDEIERLRRENEELRRLAEERIRVLTARQQAEEAEEEADQEEVEAALEDERPAEEPATEPVEAAAEEPQEEVEEVAPEPELEPEPEPEPVVAASTDLDTVDEAGLCEGKAHCLYFTYPETPQAGEDCLVFLNRASSGVLRDRPQVKLLLSFNGWEVPGDAYALRPTEARKDEFSDWWCCRSAVDARAYEMNFVFHDEEGNFENNGGQDFCQAVSGETTRASWLASAKEREAELEEVRRREEEEEEAARHARRLEEAEEADRNQALALVHDTRTSLVELRSGCFASCERDGKVVVATRPSPCHAGSKCVLVYTASGGVLQGSSQIRLHCGHNGWRDPQVVEMKKQPTFDEGGDVWCCEVEVPDAAVALNAVFSNEHGTYDNNSEKNFNVIVEIPGGEGEAHWDALASKLQAEIKAKRLAEEAAEAERRERRERRKREAREYSLEVARRKLSHVLFSEPSEIVAGETVTVYYNTKNTALAGRQDSTFMQFSFNRWSHPDEFAPVKMEPSDRHGGEGEEGWVMCEIGVPKDAYMVDFVFTDSEHGGGTFDNNGGLDYNLSVTKGPKSPPLYITHIAVEMAPIAKVGGLGDVVTALSRAVQEHGHHAEIILPRYDFLLSSPLLQGTTFEAEMDWGGCKNFVTTCVVEGVRVFFIEPSNGMFKVSQVYSQPHDDEVKFEFFCKAALEFLLQTGRQPDIIHCHDWSSASAARAYWQDYHHYGLWKPKVVFTIHNLEFGAAAIGDAAMNAQKFTTVSPSYAFEVGGHPAVEPHSAKFSGIINGIDTDIWDPLYDQFLPTPYSAENAEEGKRDAKKALRERLGLRQDRDCPVVGVVSRLTTQKGIHLIKHAAYRTLDRGGQFVLLGSAPDPKIQADFDGLAGQLGGDMGAFCYAYDEPLSHLIYAGCDVILVPSMFEPCGLTQMIAMRYGSVPVVRQTGGLRDTVFDVDHDKARAAWEVSPYEPIMPQFFPFLTRALSLPLPSSAQIHGSDDHTKAGMDGTNGFSFEGTDEGSLDYALNRAIDCWYNDIAFFRQLQSRNMTQDWSWNKPALDYIELYYSAIKG